MSRLYRNSGTYRSNAFYRGIAVASIKYTLDIPTRKNIQMHAAPAVPGTIVATESARTFSAPAVPKGKVSIEVATL